MMGDDTRAESNAFDDMFAVARADDPLTLFEAEPASGATDVQPPVPPPLKHETLPLDSVLERLHYVSWAEGVSIVDALCDELTAVADTGGRVPELSQVSITSHGTVVVASGGAKGPAGPRLARILHSLTSHGPVPAPLRLFVSRWVAFEEAHTISEFAKELAYFVRPERAALIQAVYERASAVPASLPQTPVQAAEAARPRKDSQPVASRRRTRRLAAAGIVVAASVASALTWGALSQSSTSAAMSASSLAGVSSLLASAAAGTRQLVAGIAGSSASMSAGKESTDTTSEAAPSVPTAVAPTRSANRAAGRRVPAGSLPQTSAPVTEALAGLTPGSTPSLPIESPASSLAVAPSTTREDGGESPIYSSADPDVTPPEMRHPQLPPPLLSGVQVDVNTIELIVTEAGTVERVRLLSPPRRMADMMLLSGAKTWRFEPALRDGQSVRYRLLLSWDATP